MREGMAGYLPLRLDGIERAAREACECARSVGGKTRTEELRVLFLAAAVPMAEGEIVEIGSFTGRSTVALVKGALWSGQDRVVACDPFDRPSPTCPGAGRSIYEDFTANLAGLGLLDHVEVHREFSTAMAKGWDRPIRLLWIDGDHSPEGVKADVAGFFPHLVPGAVVAFHDVGSNRFPGPLVCFMEDVLLSDRFGECGMCYRTGWSQFLGSGGRQRHRRVKRKLYGLLSAFRSCDVFGVRMRGLTRLRYQLFRKGARFQKWILSTARNRKG